MPVIEGPEPWVRMAAANGQKAANVCGAVPQLEADRRRLPRQEQVAVEPIMKDLTKDVGAVKSRLWKSSWMS